MAPNYTTLGEYIRNEEQQNGPFLATDILMRSSIIENGIPKKGVVLIERKEFPADKLALPGGIATQYLRLSENVRKEAKEETGLYAILDQPNRPFRLLSDPTMDPRAHMAAPVYTARGFGTLEAQPDEDAKNARIYTIEELETLVEQPDKWAFEHHRFYVAEYVHAKDGRSQIEETYGSKTFQRLGISARFKPLHNGAAKLLTYAALHSEHLIINIGSADKDDVKKPLNLRNPFTPNQTQEMVDMYLHTLEDKGFNFTYEINFIEDYAHLPQFKDGMKWKEELIKKNGEVDAFITGNPWVTHLLQDSYQVIPPHILVPKNEHVKVKATAIRKMMAETNSDEWKKLVPDVVSQYMTDNKLDEQFRTRFGEEAQYEYANFILEDEKLEDEIKNARGKN